MIQSMPPNQATADRELGRLLARRVNKQFTTFSQLRDNRRRNLLKT